MCAKDMLLSDCCVGSIERHRVREHDYNFKDMYIVYIRRIGVILIAIYILCLDFTSIPSIDLR